MKLAPPHNTLQPLPVDVQPAVSQNVQRSATQTDVQTIQNVQETQQTQQTQEQGTVAPITIFGASPSSSSLVLWIALIVAAIVAGGAAWLWRSF